MTYEGFFQALDTACRGKKPFRWVLGNGIRAIQHDSMMCPVAWLANELTPRLVFDEHGQIHKPYRSDEWIRAGRALGLERKLTAHLATAADGRHHTHNNLMQTHKRLMVYTQT